MFWKKNRNSCKEKEQGAYGKAMRTGNDSSCFTLLIAYNFRKISIASASCLFARSHLGLAGNTDIKQALKMLKEPERPKRIRQEFKRTKWPFNWSKFDGTNSRDIPETNNCVGIKGMIKVNASRLRDVRTAGQRCGVQDMVRWARQRRTGYNSQVWSLRGAPTFPNHVGHETRNGQTARPYPKKMEGQLDSHLAGVGRLNRPRVFVKNIRREEASRKLPFL